ncbi:uncharacterized protein LTR77_004158 [Saxophila tyrrhenica]|uniref:CENP-V/GFA domain-containing protein n=1 Tax=Saxophila tyrrhenica TaxID=1690608 RepID=A0AAV9PC71_9PEZI|nr:hypothetical protein LTR77_004158 [Saxophila tyrrhenica]
MADVNELYGSCACERNQYTIVIPTASTSLAQVFFDNSAANRRSQATPVTAWLRVPLDWVHSTTHAQFDDETHPSIRRTYHMPSIHPTLPPTRRQFCGYCGTHLTAWNEGHGHEADFLDVTLGSLMNESFDTLEALNIINAEDGEEESLVRSDMINEEDHVHPREESMEDQDPAAARQVSSRTSGAMRHRGMPYFEEMVENSRLGRIKRQKGGHTSRDGRTTVEWEVVEIGGDEPTPMETTQSVATGAGGSKRQRVGP